MPRMGSFTYSLDRLVPDGSDEGHVDKPRIDFLLRDSDSILIRLQPILYGSDSVLRAAHRFTDRCYVHIEQGADGSLDCRLRLKHPGGDLEAIAGEYANELLDQALRSRVRAETEAVRSLLLAQAFSKVNLLHPELDRADPREDPLGISQPDPDPRAASENERTGNPPSASSAMNA